MASNAISDITDEFLVCQVCLEDLKQPKMLPCLHTFCQSCLEKLLATEPVGKLDCPTCRQDVPLPRNGVQGLKSNFLVGKLRDILQQQPKEETSEAMEDGIPCTACEVGNSSQFYCVECTDYLCQTCNDTHRRFKATKSHKVVTIEDLQSGKAAAELRARETSKCEDHQELNKFYCDTCHRVICLHCVVTAHKDHRYVEIEKAAEREGAKIKAKLATVKNATVLHETWIQQLQSVKDEWSSEVQRSEEQIRKQVNLIVEAAKKAGNDRIAQLRAMNAAREKQMEAAMEAAEMDLASARSCVQFTDNVLEYGSPAELMSVAGELTGRLDQTTESKNTEKSKLTENFVNLTFDPPGGELEQEVAKLVGGINQMRTPLYPPQITQVRPNVVIGNCGTSLKHVKTVGERGGGDGQFDYPTSLAVTAEGDIVVTDHDNSRLQFLDKDGSFKGKVDLGFKPGSVAALTNGELLVTGDGHRIHVLDKQGRESLVIQVTGAAQTGGATRGVAVDGLGRVIATIEHQVFVLSPSGDVMLKFGDKGQGQQHLGSYLGVTVNSSNQIIVSDYSNHNVKIFDPAGRHLFTCGSHGRGPGQLENSETVITDSEDNIFVADCGNNHRVSVFSRDGTFIRHVLTREEHGLYCPIGLALTHDGHFVVSEFPGCIKFFRQNEDFYNVLYKFQWVCRSQYFPGLAGVNVDLGPILHALSMHRLPLRCIKMGLHPSKHLKWIVLRRQVNIQYLFTMASNAISDITDEFLVCQVCLEDFRQPRMLSCLHTFCQPCLEKLLATEPVGKLACPTCRQDVPLPRNGVQGLKFNFLVGKLRDILQQKPQQQPKGKTSEAREDGVPCTACEVGNSAQFYCVQCTDYLCRKCNYTHSRLQATKSHRVVTIQDLQSGQAAVALRGGIKRQVRTPLCSPHITQVRLDVVIGNGGASLKHVKTVGKKGSGAGQFYFPTSLAVTAEGDIVVTDCCNKRLQFLDKDGSFKKKVNLRFVPVYVAALTNGELLVTGDGHRIHVLDKQGRESRVIQVTGAAQRGGATRGVADDGLGRIIVTIEHRVFVLSPSGDVMLKFGDKGQGQQQLGSYLRVTVNSSNQIIVSDYSNHNVKVFDPTGRHLFTCGSHGRGPGQLENPETVITDSEDNIIVADFGNDRVSMFSRDGTFIRHVLTRKEHGLYRPLGLALTHDGHFVVSEFPGCIKFFRGK
ncbi:tripartite motif-containing protein 2-like [Branchiostoma floridae]|uniref:RING-type E3 ubiquitin transferase n=3 Tax=Branchiostoma floridae TaxID=7739 RepID=A0A9J7MWN6_BRAFL|nr:tripartite motif-containing protein 2-like [Branchiostoma floridae]